MVAVAAHGSARDRIVVTREGQLIADTSPAPIITAALWSWRASQSDGADTCATRQGLIFVARGGGDGASMDKAVDGT
jgi:hypothetical protein